MRGSAALGGMPQASDLHLLGLQMVAVETAEQDGVLWSWDLQQHQHPLPVDPGLREDW